MFHVTAREPGQSVDDKLNALKSTERSNEWLLAASMKLCPIIRRLKKLTSLHSKALRMELFELSDVLLRNCQKCVKLFTIFYIGFDTTKFRGVSKLKLSRKPQEGSQTPGGGCWARLGGLCQNL